MIGKILIVASIVIIFWGALDLILLYAGTRTIGEIDVITVVSVSAVTKGNNRILTTGNYDVKSDLKYHFKDMAGNKVKGNDTYTIRSRFTSPPYSAGSNLEITYIKPASFLNSMYRPVSLTTTGYIKTAGGIIMLSIIVLVDKFRKKNKKR